MTRPHESKKKSLAAMNRETPGFSSEATKQNALAIVGWLDEKKAKDISVLDVAAFSSVADVMLLCTAQSVRHAQALADWILEKYAENGISYLGMEGYDEGRWILVDGNEILVHILQQESREFYNLDGLWAQGASLLPVAD